MLDLLKALKDTPIPTILTVAGILFLVLGVAGGIVGKIQVAPNRQRISLAMGGLLLVIGVAIDLLAGSERRDETGPGGAAAKVDAGAGSAPIAGPSTGPAPASPDTGRFLDAAREQRSESGDNRLNRVAAKALAGNALTEVDVQDLDDESLIILRNAPYARHGRAFVRADLHRYYYGGNPYSLRIDPSFIEAMLDDTDWHNVSMVAARQSSIRR